MFIFSQVIFDEYPDNPVLSDVTLGMLRSESGSYLNIRPDWTPFLVKARPATDEPDRRLPVCRYALH